MDYDPLLVTCRNAEPLKLFSVTYGVVFLLRILKWQSHDVSYKIFHKASVIILASEGLDLINFC